MTSSLVGSEMCIRDRCDAMYTRSETCSAADEERADRPHLTAAFYQSTICLLYTSDAADDM
eukprot:827530-Prorocentrum_lima.AAC.1